MKKIYMLLILSLLSIGLIACGTGDVNNDNSNVNQGEKSADQGDIIKITHELGESSVQKNPEKIIVFDFGALDTLDKLGIEVTGVPQGNIPAYLDKYSSNDYENVGSLKEPDFEKIAEIDPDLIIISGRQSTLYDQLEELGPTVYIGIDTTRYMDSFKENLNIIGEIFDKTAEIEEEINTIEQSIETLQEKASKQNKKGLIILANDNKISAYGPNSRFGIIHDVFGIPAVDENIEASTHGQNVSFEYIRETDPDLLYVIDRTAAVGGETSAESLVENKLSESTKAYQNDQIYYLNPDYWYLSGGGLASVVAMIDEIAASLE